MPSTSTTANTQVPAPASSADSAETREYEVLVIPPVAIANPAESDAATLRTKTKRITCTGQRGAVFWIPEGYKPVLVRTTDLPLLVGAEFPVVSSVDDGEDSN